MKCADGAGSLRASNGHRGSAMNALTAIYVTGLMLLALSPAAGEGTTSAIRLECFGISFLLLSILNSALILNFCVVKPQSRSLKKNPIENCNPPYCRRGCSDSNPFLATGQFT